MIRLIPRGSGEVIEIDRRLANRSPRLDQYIRGEEVVIDAPVDEIQEYIHYLETGEIEDAELVKTIFRVMGHPLCPAWMDAGYCAAALEDHWFESFGGPEQGLLEKRTWDPPPEYVLGYPYYFVGETALKWMGIMPQDQPGVQIALLGPEEDETMDIQGSASIDASGDFVSIVVDKTLWSAERIMEFAIPAKGRRFEEEIIEEPTVGKWSLLPKGKDTQEAREAYRRQFLSGFTRAREPLQAYRPKPPVRPSLPSSSKDQGSRIIIIPGEGRTQSMVTDLTLYNDVAQMVYALYPSYRQIAMDASGHGWMTRKAWWIHSHKIIYLKVEDMEFVYASNLLALKNDRQYKIRFTNMNESDRLHPLATIAAMEYVLGENYYYNSFKEPVKDIIDWLRYGVPETVIDKRGKEQTIMHPVDRNDEVKMKSYANAILGATDTLLQTMPSPFVESIYDRWLELGRQGKIPGSSSVYPRPWLIHAQLLMQYDFAFNSPFILFPMDYPISYTSAIPWKIE